MLQLTSVSLSEELEEEEEEEEEDEDELESCCKGGKDVRAHLCAHFRQLYLYLLLLGKLKNEN